MHPPNNHNLWNAKTLTGLLQTSSTVFKWRNYGQLAGIHFLTLKGMVDTHTTAYSVIEVHKDRLELKGFGRQQGRTFSLKR